MKSLPTVIALASLLALFGCPGPDAAKKEPEAGAPKTENGKEVPKEVAAALKHEAYEWMGFNRLEPFTYELTKMEGAAPTEGSQTLAYIGGDEKAGKFQYSRTGALEQLGDEEFEVRPDGIYLISMPPNKLEKPALMMPAKLNVGASWPCQFDFTSADGKKFSFKLTNKAERIEKVKAKAGEFDALLISATGNISITHEGKTQVNDVNTKTWYVKGLGQVKMSLEVKVDGLNNKFSVELIKAGTSEASAGTP